MQIDNNLELVGQAECGDHYLALYWDTDVFVLYAGLGAHPKSPNHMIALTPAELGELVTEGVTGYHTYTLADAIVTTDASGNGLILTAFFNDGTRLTLTSHKEHLIAMMMAAGSLVQ